MRSPLIALAVSSALVLAACGGDDGGDDGLDTAAPAVTDAAAGDDTAVDQAFNDADVLFAQSMIPHHEQAIEMSDIALDPTVAAGDEVRALAEEIRAAQDPEVQQMTALLTDWGAPLQMDMSDGHDMADMEGMFSLEEIEALGALTGAEFDQRWLQMMIEHHEGAISMAETVLDAGVNPEIAALAEAIIAAQRAEIEVMTGLLAG